MNSNDYFSHDIKLVPGTKARAEDMNSRFDALDLGLAKLPIPYEGGSGFAEPILVGGAISLGHAVTAGQAVAGGLSYSGADTGAANAHVVTLPIAPAAYTDGLRVCFKAATGNTGAATINVNGLGIKGLVRSTGVALVAGDIVAGQIVTVVYNGTQFRGITAFQGSANPVEIITHAATSKATPVDGDEIPLVDSAASFGLKKLTWANLKATIKAALVRADVGLGSVDNTSDADKPVSTAQQTALNLKANLASPTFTGTVGGVTKGMVGLGSVDNTSDANKPVSTAQGTAIGLKQTASDKDATGGYAGLTLFKINFKNAANTFTSFFANANTAARTYTFQDRDGTIADNTDLGLKAPLASPALTGIPTAPTQGNTDNSTRLATTAFIRNIMAGVQAASGYRAWPDGTTVQWGLRTLPATPAAPLAILWPVPFTTFYACVASGFTNNTNSNSAWIDTPTTTGCNIHGTLASQSAYFIAVGHITPA